MDSLKGDNMEPDKLILSREVTKSRRETTGQAINPKSQAVVTPVKPATVYRPGGYFGYSGGNVRI